MPWARSTARALGGRREARRERIVLEEGVRQGDRVDVGRQRRVDDEAHRHVARLAGLQRLRGEAEAFGLAEVARGARRRHRRHRVADDRAIALVARVVRGLVLLARTHAHRHLLRMERPGQLGIDAAVELHGDRASFSALASAAACSPSIAVFSRRTPNTFSQAMRYSGTSAKVNANAASATPTSLTVPRALRARALAHCARHPAQDEANSRSRPRSPANNSAVRRARGASRGLVVRSGARRGQASRALL